MTAPRSERRGGPASPRPRGLSLVEVQIAFVVLGLLLAGLAPTVIAQFRQHRRLQARFPAGTTFHLVPSDDRWAQKLGVRARLQTAGPPGPVAAPAVSNGQIVENWSYNAALDEATATVNTNPSVP